MFKITNTQQQNIIQYESLINNILSEEQYTLAWSTVQIPVIFSTDYFHVFAVSVWHHNRDHGSETGSAGSTDSSREIVLEE